MWPSGQRIGLAIQQVPGSSPTPVLGRLEINSLATLLTAKDPLSFCITNQRAYLFIADGKVAWGRLGKSISLNSGFVCEIASLNFDSFDQNRKEPH